MDSSREGNRKHQEEEEEEKKEEDETTTSLVDVNLMVVLLYQLYTTTNNNNNNADHKDTRDHVAREARQSRARANKRLIKETKLMEKKRKRTCFILCLKNSGIPERC
ncbi:unnamed protein product, partial [Cochlearia groenlandica]